MGQVKMNKQQMREFNKIFLEEQQEKELSPKEEQEKRQNELIKQLDNKKAVGK